MTEHVIRAKYNDRTIRVYQAYRPEIALPALQAGRFVAPFRMTRMTWIKPSFNWMMYRCGYATKPGQEVVLGIDITREGFEWALAHAALARFIPSVHASHDEWRTLLEDSCVRVQWDPERDWRLNIMQGVRSIQIGLAGEALERYLNNWILHMEDVTQLARRIAADLRLGVTPEHLPHELEAPYPLNLELQARISRE